MDLLLSELAASLPDPAQAVRITIRFFAAIAVGAIVGFEREQTGKAAGLRTHLLVSVASALFVLAPLEGGMSTNDVSRVIQGVATGIGFIGAGAILKRKDDSEIQGLTTAAGIWLTAAAGLAAGLGRLGLALAAAFLAWVILRVVERIDAQVDGTSLGGSKTQK
jgi:putative Mg2+ transporter-C (MgtC) family protein